MSVTTKNGDKGYTNLLNDKMVLKSDLRIKLLGEIDELSSYLGMLKSHVEEEKIKEELSWIQKNISTVMAQVAEGSGEKYNLFKVDLDKIEALIKEYEGLYIPKNSFILPGETKVSSIMDVCRSITRKVERRLIEVDYTYPIEEACKVYFNRLSDYLFTIARYIDFKEEITKRVKEELKITKTHKLMNLSYAKELIAKVEQKATEVGLPVVIAIANPWGNIIAVHFMDGALPGSYDIAVNKAYTTAIFRMSTMKLGTLSKDGGTLQNINTTDPRIVVFGGGQPILNNNNIIGTIGVSGGSGEQDDELARYGAGII